MPYKCTACNKSFRYKVSQRSHKCPVNPPGSVVRIPEAEKPPESNEPSPKSFQNDGQCITSVDHNMENMIADEYKSGAIFTVSGGFPENEQIQKESIVLNNNEQIEIRYNKADLQLAINKSETVDDHKRREKRSVDENSSKVSDCAQSSLGKFRGLNQIIN